MTASTLQLREAGFGRINTLVFDLDGTLIDSTAGVRNALSAAFQSAGRMMPAMDMRRVIGPPITVIARRIEPLLSDAEVAVIERSYRAIYDSNGWRDAFAYPAVVDTLHIFHRRGLRLFIVTNKPLLPTSNILAHLGFDGLFIEALSRDSRTPHYVSKSEMLADLLTRHHLLSDTALMVGDTSEDQEAAHSNGLAFLQVTYGYGSVLTSAHRINHFSEIATLLSATTTLENQPPQRYRQPREI
jgi:phosphoglycolate phosphatase